MKVMGGQDGWLTWGSLMTSLWRIAYPLTNIQENLQKLKGAKIFTSIDACGAYHAIQIEEGSRECTAFISPFGTFRYIGMPFGLSNSGSVYTWTWPWHNYLWNTGSRIWTTFLYIPWTPRTTGSIWRALWRLTLRQGSSFNLRRPRYFRQKPNI